MQTMGGKRALTVPIMVVTRPAAQAQRFADEIIDAFGLPLTVLISPVLDIVPQDVAVDLTALDVAVVTSTNGAAQLPRLGVPVSAEVWCVGDRTAQRAADLGYKTHSVGGTVDDLVRALLIAGPAGSIAHLRGRHTTGDLADRLAEADMHCAEVVTYDQVERSLSAAVLAAAKSSAPMIFPVFSPRSGAIILPILPDEARIMIVAISENAAAPFGDMRHATVSVAARPDADAMRDATLFALRSFDN